MLEKVLARIPRSADPGVILVALVVTIVLVVVVLGTTSRKIKRLGADLAKRGFVASDPPGNKWTTPGTYEPILRGAWKGKSATVKYAGRYRRGIYFRKMPPRHFTIIEVQGKTSEVPGWADATVVAMELDALASYGESTATPGP